MATTKGIPTKLPGVANAEPDPVELVRAIRNRLNEEAGGDIGRRIAATNKVVTPALIKKLGLKVVKDPLR